MAAIDPRDLYRKLDEVYSTAPDDAGTLKGVIESYVLVEHGDAHDDYDWTLDAARDGLVTVIVESAAAVGLAVTAEQADDYLEHAASRYAKSEHEQKYEDDLIEASRPYGERAIALGSYF